MPGNVQPQINIVIAGMADIVIVGMAVRLTVPCSLCFIEISREDHIVFGMCWQCFHNEFEHTEDCNDPDCDVPGP